MMQSLRNKTALLTGASSGIGRAAAKAFAEPGMRVAISARSEERLAAIALELGPDAIMLPADLTRPEEGGWARAGASRQRRTSW